MSLDRASLRRSLISILRSRLDPTKRILVRGGWSVSRPAKGPGFPVFLRAPRPLCEAPVSSDLESSRSLRSPGFRAPPGLRGAPGPGRDDDARPEVYRGGATEISAILGIFRGSGMVVVTPRHVSGGDAGAFDIGLTARRCVARLAEDLRLQLPGRQSSREVDSAPRRSSFRSSPVPEPGASVVALELARRSRSEGLALATRTRSRRAAKGRCLRGAGAGGRCARRSAGVPGSSRASPITGPDRRVRVAPAA